MSNVAEVREFIVENFLFGDDSDLSNDSLFFESGIVDSTGILEIVTFLEENFEISVADEDLIPENFSSIETIDHYLKKKLNGKLE